mmetsp:Transcript_4253/g.12801  ORF Transcript_4253/g.12801 Transcript_4253/m.12801 type:complete len:387 (+) Transcript_4253:294-1454(+)
MAERHARTELARQTSGDTSSKRDRDSPAGLASARNRARLPTRRRRLGPRRRPGPPRPPLVALRARARAQRLRLRRGGPRPARAGGRQRVSVRPRPDVQGRPGPPAARAPRAADGARLPPRGRRVRPPVAGRPADARRLVARTAPGEIPTGLRPRRRAPRGVEAAQRVHQRRRADVPGPRAARAAAAAGVERRPVDARLPPRGRRVHLPVAGAAGARRRVITRAAPGQVQTRLRQRGRAPRDAQAARRLRRRPGAHVRGPRAARVAGSSKRAGARLRTRRERRVGCGAGARRRGAARRAPRGAARREADSRLFVRGRDPFGARRRRDGVRLPSSDRRQEADVPLRARDHPARRAKNRRRRRRRPRVSTRGRRVSFARRHRGDRRAAE